MRQDLVDWLLDGSAVTALCSTRINWDERPQGEGLPAVTLSLIPGAQPGYTMDGARSGLRKHRVQVDCWAATGVAATSLRVAVEDRLGLINLNDAAAPLEGCFALSEPASTIDELGGGGRVFRQFMDFAVWRRG